MLKTMRSNFQHLKWILIFIVFLFVLFVFVQWGAGGAGQSGDVATGYVARVNGETVPVSDYERTMYYMEKNYEQMYGQNFTPELRQMLNLPQQAVTTLVDQKLLLQQARKLDLSATPDEVKKRILEIQVLNPGGKFIGADLYQRYVTSALGFQSTAAFEDQIAQEITLGKLESALENSIIISPKDAEDEYRRRSESAKIHYVLYPANRAMVSVNVTPADVQQYYDQHKAKYAHGEQRRIDYLIADMARIRASMKVDEATLRAAYESQKDKFKMGESVHAAHILIKPAGSTPADDEAAKKKAEDIVKQLRAGGNFAELAKKNSGDPGSASNGGDLGFFERGQMVQAFEQSAFTLPIGEISDPVKTQFGYHIIKVLEKKESGYRPFEQVRMQLEQNMLTDRAKDQAREAIARVNAQIQASAPKDEAAFRALANPQVAVNDSGWVSKADPAIPGVGRNPALTSWAAEAKVGAVGPIVETSRGPMIPFLAESRDAGTSSLDEVKAQVEQEARAAKSREAAKTALAAALSGGIDGAASSLGLTAADASITRGGFIQGLTGDTKAIAEAALAGKLGEVKGPVVVDQGAVAFSIVEQNRFNPQLFETEKASLIQTMRQQEARKLRASLLAKLRKESEIVTNDKLIQQNAGASRQGA